MIYYRWFTEEENPKCVNDTFKMILDEDESSYHAYKMFLSSLAFQVILLQVDSLQR